jgi:hypothetical protein
MDSPPDQELPSRCMGLIQSPLMMLDEQQAIVARFKGYQGVILRSNAAGRSSAFQTFGDQAEVNGRLHILSVNSSVPPAGGDNTGYGMSLRNRI